MFQCGSTVLILSPSHSQISLTCKPSQMTAYAASQVSVAPGQHTHSWAGSSALCSPLPCLSLSPSCPSDKLLISILGGKLSCSLWCPCFHVFFYLNWTLTPVFIYKVLLPIWVSTSSILAPHGSLDASHEGPGSCYAFSISHLVFGPSPSPSCSSSIQTVSSVNRGH